jgi:hypothetical protein
MARSFSGGRRWSTWREPPTMDKQLLNYITCGCESSAQIINHLVQVALGFIYNGQKFRLSQEKEGIMDRVEKHFPLQL